MPRSRSASVKGALLGLDHPHALPYLNSLHNLPEVASVFVWDETGRFGGEAALPRRHKVELFTTDLDAILARRDLDFVILCVRTDLSAAIARKVAAAGKHLLVEKPVGLNSQEIHGLIQAVRRARVKASVLYTMHHSPAPEEARRLVAAGAIGRLLTIEARMLTTAVRFRDPKCWLFKRRQAGGGVLTWLGCHYLDVIQRVANDRIVSVSAELATRSGEKIDVEDAAALSLRFRSGAVGTFQIAYVLAHAGSGYVNAAGYDNHISWNGHLGRLVWLGNRPVLTLHVESPVRRGSPIRELTFPLAKSDSYGGQIGDAFIRQFLQAGKGGVKLPSTLEDALRTAEIVEAAERSSRTGRRVRV